MASIVVNGDTSGAVTLSAPATAGTVTVILPSTSGTMATLTTPSFATTIGVGGATPSASGTGITFPATQSASSDANTLDDYEEGTWTPTLSFGSGSVTYTTQTGRYTKIGKLVTVQAYLEINAASSPSSFITLNNIPFTPAVPDALGTAAINANTMLTTVAGNWVANPRTSDIRIWTYSGGTLNNAGANVQANSEFWLTCSYEV